MSDPFPEARRQARHDRTDHGRAAESHHRDRGPTPEQVSRALEAVADHDVPGDPGVGPLKALRHVAPDRRKTDTRRVRNMSIISGEPRHGAKRSDDHIGRYEIRVPFAEVDDDVAGDRCPECRGKQAVFRYRAHHFIAGGDSLFCHRCEEQIHSNEWG